MEPVEMERTRGWPSSAEKGLSKSRRRAMLSAIDVQELKSIVGCEKRVVEEKLRGLLMLFGLGEEDYNAEEFELFVNEALGQTVCERHMQRPVVQEPTLKHWHFPADTLESNYLHSEDFIDKAQSVCKTACYVTSRTTKACPAILLKDSIILAPSLCFAHVTHARTASVTFCDYPNSPSPRITVPLNPKVLLISGMGAGTYFSYFVLDVTGTQHITIEIGSDLDTPKKKETFPAGTPLIGSLPIDSIITLDCTEGVLLKVIEGEGDVLTLFAIEGSHGLDAIPRGGKGVVHRVGTSEAYVAAALKTSGVSELTTHQQNILRSILDMGHSLEAPDNSHSTPGSLVTFTQHGMQCRVATLTIKKTNGVHHVTMNEAVPSPHTGGLVFDLNWNFIAFFTMLGDVLHLASIVQDMKLKGYADFVRGNRVTQGSGLLDGRLLKANPDSKQNKMEAERLEWGEKGLDFNKPVVIPQTCDEFVTFPPFSVVLKGSQDQIDTLATRNVVVSIEVTPEGYTTQHNKTFLTRGTGVFYHLTVSPAPKEKFRLVARVEIIYTGTVRYPLLRRHMMPQYPVSTRPPLTSLEIEAINIEPTQEEADLFNLRREVEKMSEARAPEDEVKTFYINHFSDSCKTSWTVGTKAARMFTAMQHSDTESGKVSLVLFSGNGFGSSIHASVTQGRVMPNLLNALCVDVAVVGNHDLDFGLERFAYLSRACQFPWVLSNVLHKTDKKPIQPAVSTAVVQAPGTDIKIGLVGLVEEEWVTNNIPLRNEYAFEDMVTVARELSLGLRKTCDVVVALTHMKLANDVALAEGTQGAIDVILGGHEQEASRQLIGKIPVIKSGSGFDSFSRIEVRMKGKAIMSVPCGELVTVGTEHLPDVSILQTIADGNTKFDIDLDKVLVTTDGAFDVTAAHVRTSESAIGNFITDLMLGYYKPCKAQAAILQAGCLRSDKVFEAGKLTIRDLFSIVPIEDPLVLLQVSGSELTAMLEEWVAECPLETVKFPQVAGLKITVDVERPPLSRVLEISYQELDGSYGFLTDSTSLALVLPYFLCATSCLRKCKKIIPPEEGIILPTLLQAALRDTPHVTPRLESRVTILH
eukprot:TRINITY_DN8685_c0_g1_i1.p1 TRINITY_DN8685_c0_g1~~TRINITY_DN8685_c0_g1_i1.p1  ORF type:complete len:1093 (+),score=153.37 TRINITY_DN8685_c0_g1_i1:278-3556(+)